MTLAYAFISVSGAALVLTGLYFQLYKKKLNSDPVLITACYVWGGLNIAACMF